MGLELIDAGSSLEAEDVNIIILASHGKRLLSRQLASDTDPALANEERLLADKIIRDQVCFVHFNESIRGHYDYLLELRIGG